MYLPEQCITLFEEQLQHAAIENMKPAGLYLPAGYAMTCGGKRVRPVLVLMACNLFSDDIQNALMPALALEVFHNFTLLHDDVMDNADMRRNRPTVHRRWNSNTAILSGDAMMIMACRYMCSAPTNVTHELLDLFTHTALEVCEGQQYDMDFEQRTDVTLDEYMDMIRLKTAVLLAACLKTGAICGGADNANAEQLYRFGISLGLTFQIQDDCMDVYADPNVFGKATGGDILSAKKTFLLLTAFAQANSKIRRELDELLHHSPDLPAAEKIDRVKTIYNQLGVNRAAHKNIDVHYRRAMQHLENVKLPDPLRKMQLEAFADSLLHRAK